LEFEKKRKKVKIKIKIQKQKRRVNKEQWHKSEIEIKIIQLSERQTYEVVERDRERCSLFSDHFHGHNFSPF